MPTANSTPFEGAWLCTYHPRVKELSAHAHCKLHPVVLDGLVVVLDGHDVLSDVLGDLQAGQSDQVAETLVALKGLMIKALKGLMTKV